MSTRDLVLAHYQSLERKDDRWQGLYAADAVFKDASGTLDARGRDAVIQAFVPFLKGVEGVRVKQLIVEDDAACAVIGYSYVNSKGHKLAQDVAEVWKTGDWKLAALTVYFDLTAYRAFIRG